MAVTRIPATRRGLLQGAASLIGLAATGGSAAVAAGSGGVTIDKSCRLSAGRLDSLVAKIFPLFNAPATLPDFDAKAQAARFDVDLHRLTTTTVHPLTGQSLKVSGLLALPAGPARQVPLISWQHGTIFSFGSVPSNLTALADETYEPADAVDSLETLLNLQRFVGQGYALVAADYVGKGPLRGDMTEAYAVKEVSVRNCLDMLSAGEAAMTQLGFRKSGLYLHGWSQGALNTLWLHQALRAMSQPIVATAVASPFNDANEAWRYWAGAQSYALPDGVTSYPSIPSYIALCQFITLASYEVHYGFDGLLRAAVRPEYHGLAAQFLKNYTLEADELASLPAGDKVLVPGFLERATSPQGSAFLRRLAANRATYWDYDNPIRFHYGLADEAINPGMVFPALAAGGKLAQGVAVPGASHRVTFLAGMYGTASSLSGQQNVLQWFGSLA